MKNFKYFTYGLPQSGDAAYGLYEPTLGCFLTVSTSLPTIKKLKAILSSRYGLQIVCISDADNFESNSIDNECCENWSVSNKKELQFTDLLQNIPVISAKSLCPANPVIFSLIEEKQWILMCAFWIGFVTELETNIYVYSDIDRELRNVIDTVDIGYMPNDLFQQIMKLLYLGRNIDDTDQEILNLIKKNNVTAHHWQYYYEKFKCQK
jgi:hypothetical protein